MAIIEDISDSDHERDSSSSRPSRRSGTTAPPTPSSSSLLSTANLNDDDDDDDSFPSLWHILTSQDYFEPIAILLLLSEVFLCYGIIGYVQYTEIDWSTYQQQVSQFLAGERDYSLIKGSTGPLVYPAGHLYVYSALHWLTNGGKDIKTAQYVFAEIYVVTLGLVFWIFKRCGTVPPLMMILLTFSKRLHSIYVLRLFNDPIAMLFFYGAVMCWTCRKPRWTWGSVLFSVALSIKMNLLLYLPSLLYLFFTTLSPLSTLLQVSVIFLIQLLLALPFLSTPSHTSSYLHSAFNFSRSFEWEWTVNWRWLGEEAFGSKGLRGALLMLHVGGLVLVGLNWGEGDGGVVGIIKRGLRYPTRPASFVRGSADRTCTILFTGNLVGILFARSLHYQFYSWYAHQLPFLVVHTPYELLPQIGLLAVIEYGWNKYPSTLNSSLALTGANAALLMGVYYHYGSGVRKVGEDDGEGGGRIKVE